MANVPEDPLYDRPESADYIKSNTKTMDRWRETGFGPVFVKIGHRVFYQKSSLDDFINRQRRTHTGENAVQAAV